METALPLIVVGVLVTVAVTAIAPKMGVAGPLALVVVGIAVSLTPWWHDLFPQGFEVEPDIVLELILPPLLYAAAVSMPTMDFRRNLRFIAGLAVVLVIVSAVAVGLLLHWLLDVRLALGIAVGAVVSPTDAVATAIVRKAGLSPRIVTVLEGEALFNDATALVLLRTAKGVLATSAVTVAALTTPEKVNMVHVGRDFVWAVLVAVAIGWVAGKLNLVVRSRLSNPSKSVAVSLVTPFVAAIPTEHLHGSGLVAAVVAGLVIGYGSPSLSAQERLNEKAVWGTVNMVLEGGIFLLMGLQTAALVEHVDDAHDSALLALEVGALVALVIMVLRAGFIGPALWGLSRRRRRGGTRERLAALQKLVDDDVLRRVSAAFPGDGRRAQHHEDRMQRMKIRIARRSADLDYLADQHLGPKEGVVLVWAGMRGAITLAAVQTLPTATEHRALLVLVAFVVAVGTLLVQGATLPYLVRWLKLDTPSDDDDERRALRADLTAARMARLDAADLKRPNGQPFDAEMIEHVRAELEELHEHLLEPTAESRAWRAQFRELRQVLIKAQRVELVRQRNLGTYQSELLDEALDQLDADQLGLDMR